MVYDSQVMLNNQVYPIRIHRSKRYRNLRIRFSDGKLVATLPYFVTEHSKPFLEMVQMYQMDILGMMEQKPLLQRYLDVRNQMVKWFGKWIPFQMIKISGLCKMEIHATYILFYIPMQHLEKEILSCLFQEYQKYILPIWEEEQQQILVQNGYPLSSFSIRMMKSRWGSCHVQKKHVTLNGLLVFYPLECSRVVIVHELCHFLIQNHSKAFYQLVHQYDPNDHQANRLLKEEQHGFDF